MDAQGLPAIVTGGGSGLGAGAARALATAGAKVAVLDINKAAADAVAAMVAAKNARRPLLTGSSFALASSLLLTGWVMLAPED